MKLNANSDFEAFEYCVILSANSQSTAYFTAYPLPTMLSPDAAHWLIVLWLCRRRRRDRQLSERGRVPAAAGDQPDPPAVALPDVQAADPLVRQRAGVRLDHVAGAVPELPLSRSPIRYPLVEAVTAAMFGVLAVVENPLSARRIACHLVLLCTLLCAALMKSTGTGRRCGYSFRRWPRALFGF